MKVYNQILLFLIVLIALSCREESTEPPKGNLQLTAIDIGVYDVIIRLTAYVSHGPAAISITENGRNVFFRPMPIRYASFDTTYRFSGLQQGDHIFKAFYWIGETKIDSSAPLNVTMMSGSSGNFLWEVHTLGDDIANRLNDVAIINDTCVWVVGEINKLDSAGSLKRPPYNIAVWNGKSWILSTTIDSGFLYGENYSIYAFNENDVWIGGTVPKHWNGEKWKFYGLSSGYEGGFRILGIWGSSSEDLYIVGENGNIRWYNGFTWQNIESGIDANIVDIYGSKNIKTGELEILAIATDVQLEKRYIIEISGGTVSFLSDSGMWGPITLTGVWFEAGKRYYICGLPVFFKIDLNQPIWYGYDFSSGNSTYKCIRGNRFNDLVIASWLNEIAHFNGYEWKSYSQELGLNNAHWYSVDMKGDMIVAVGNYGTGLVAIGRR